MIPSAEEVITELLKADDAVAAITTRIRPKTPKTLDEPWVRLTLLDDPPTDGGITNHHIEAYVDLECFAGEAGNQSTADNLSRAVIDALWTGHQQDLESGVITGPARWRRSRRPDQQHEPAMERYVVSATVWIRSK